MTDLDAENAAFFAKLEKKFAGLTPRQRQQRIKRLQQSEWIGLRQLLELVMLVKRIPGAEAERMIREGLASGKLVGHLGAPSRKRGRLCDRCVTEEKQKSAKSLI